MTALLLDDLLLASWIFVLSGCSVAILSFGAVYAMWFILIGSDLNNSMLRI